MKTLEQIQRHLDTLHEELLDFECHFFLERRNCNEAMVRLVRGEIECEKSLVKIITYLSEVISSKAGERLEEGRRVGDQLQRAFYQRRREMIRSTGFLEAKS